MKCVISSWCVGRHTCVMWPVHKCCCTMVYYRSWGWKGNVYWNLQHYLKGSSSVRFISLNVWKLQPRLESQILRFHLWHWLWTEIYPQKIYCFHTLKIVIIYVSNLFNNREEWTLFYNNIFYILTLVKVFFGLILLAIVAN